jgi:hypothetical protein
VRFEIELEIRSFARSLDVDQTPRAAVASRLDDSCIPSDLRGGIASDI